MSTIIGLGNAGCNIAKKLSAHKQYKVYYINTEGGDEKKLKVIPKQESFEDYEKNFPSIKTFLKHSKEPYTVIIGGSGAISGCTLRLLEQIRSSDITVLYIKPDIDLLSDIANKQERIAFHVLQQYARSGLLKKMFVVSNSKCEEILGDLTIKNYFDKINDLISSTYHIYNVFQNVEPIIHTYSATQEMCKIATFGILDEEGREALLYDLKFPREKHLYYSICKKNLESDASLIKNIKKQVRTFMTDKMKVSYAVYENGYDHDYIYSCCHASMIQEENYDFPLDDRN